MNMLDTLHQGHIQTLARGNWPGLVVWHIGDLKKYSCVWCYSLPNASDAAIALLAKGHWPKLQELQLDGGSISAAGIAQLHYAFALRSCSLHSVGALISNNAGFLRSYMARVGMARPEGQQVGRCSHFTSWGSILALLKELDLSCTGLNHEAFEQLWLFGSSNSNSSWPALTHLNVSGNNMRHLSLPLLPIPADAS